DQIAFTGRLGTGALVTSHFLGGLSRATNFHMQITPAAKAEANSLVRLNPDYQQWIRAIPDAPDHQPVDVDRYTFVRAAAW
ncbi:hypothetical protein ACC724_39480, partial [Rhizobium ruizarguesonis]